MTEYDIGWLAGIIDGDGCISIDENKVVRIIIIMTDEKTIYHIKDLTKIGSITKINCSISHPKWKDQYKWIIYNNDTINILNKIKDHLIIKQLHAELALEYLTKKKLNIKHEDLKVIYEKIKELNARKLNKKYHINLDNYELTKYKIGWLAGIIDSEGSIDIIRKKKKNNDNTYSYGTRIVINMTCEIIINIIQKLTNIGVISKIGRTRPNWNVLHVWRISGNQISNFLKLIFDYLITKRQQAELILEFLNLWNIVKSNNRSLDKDIELEVLHDKMRILNKRGR